VALPVTAENIVKVPKENMISRSIVYDPEEGIGNSYILNVGGKSKVIQSARCMFSLPQSRHMQELKAPRN